RRFSECLRSAEESRTVEVVILRDRQPRAAFQAFREAAPIAQLPQDLQALPVPVAGCMVVPEGVCSLANAVQALAETLSIAEPAAELQAVLREPPRRGVVALGPGQSRGAVERLRSLGGRGLPVGVGTRRRKAVPAYAEVRVNVPGAPEGSQQAQPRLPGQN